MKKNKIVLGLAAILVITVLLAGCVGDKTVKQGISSDDAVKLAKQRVQADGVMSLDGRTTVVKEEQDYWHISFPISSPNVIGGEPHVLIDKASGAITRVYYTQ